MYVPLPSSEPWSAPPQQTCTEQLHHVVDFQSFLLNKNLLSTFTPRSGGEHGHTHTYFWKNAVFDLDVTFETKTPVDTKEALRFNKLLCVLMCGWAAQQSLRDHRRSCGGKSPTNSKPLEEQCRGCRKGARSLQGHSAAHNTVLTAPGLSGFSTLTADP